MADIDQILVIHDYSTRRGGASTLAVEAVQQYRARGIPVTLFSGEVENEALQETGAKSVSRGAKPLRELPTLSALSQGYHRSATAKALGAWIAQHATPGTVYHMNNWSQTLSPSVFEPLRQVADRTVITCHDYFNTCPNGAFLHFGRSQACTLKPLSLACATSACDRRSHLHKLWRLARQRHLNAVADFGRAPYTFSFIHERMRDRFEAAGFPIENSTVIRNPDEAWCSERVQAERNSDFFFVGGGIWADAHRTR